MINLHELWSILHNSCGEDISRQITEPMLQNIANKLYINGFKPLGAFTNTETLLFVLGYQGGTIHQLADELGVSQDDIFNANNERMGELARLAQQKQRERLSQPNIMIGGF